MLGSKKIRLGMTAAVVIFGMTGMAGMAGGAQAQASSAAKVWVAQKDGTKSCGVEEIGTVTTVEQATALLAKAGVKVLKAKKGQDGRLRAQMCGTDTGSQNRVLILEKDLKKAQAKGFDLVQGD